MEFPFKKKEPEQSVGGNLPEAPPMTPEEALTNIVHDLPTDARAAFLEQLAENIKIKLSSEKVSSEVRRVDVEELPIVITTDTDLDKYDDVQQEWCTATDRLGLHIHYQGTKGFIPYNQAPMFHFANLGAILPRLKDIVYFYEYEYEDNGIIKKDKETGKPIIKKKHKIHLGVLLSNLDARTNLAVGGRARLDQKQVIIGYGGTSPIGTDLTRDDYLDLLMGDKRKGKK